MEITEPNCTEVLKYLCSYSSSHSPRWCKDYRNWCQGAEFNYRRARRWLCRRRERWDWRRKLCGNRNPSQKGQKKTTKNCARKKTINLGWPGYSKVSQILLCWNFKCVAIVWVFFWSSCPQIKVKRVNHIFKPQFNVFWWDVKFSEVLL